MSCFFDSPGACLLAMHFGLEETGHSRRTQALLIERQTAKEAIMAGGSAATRCDILSAPPPCGRFPAANFELIQGRAMWFGVIA